MSLRHAALIALALIMVPVGPVGAGEPPAAPASGAEDGELPAPRMSDTAPPRFGADRRRAVDPAHDVGFFMPRADTLGEGRTSIRGTELLVGLTLSHGVTDTVQLSLTGGTIFLLAGEDFLPLVASAKWAFVRTPSLVVSAIGTLSGAVGSATGFGPTVGVLVDGFVGTQVGLHASAIQLLPPFIVGAGGAEVLPLVAINVMGGVSIRITDWLFALIEAHGSIVGADGEIVPSGNTFRFLGGLRLSGTRFSVDGGLLVGPDVRPDVVPMISWTARN